MSERDPDLAPETVNREQDDEETQAQSVADASRGRSSDEFGLEDSVKVTSGDFTDDAQDLVDHMRQMTTSGRIDMSAFAGERDDDDEADEDA